MTPWEPFTIRICGKDWSVKWQPDLLVTRECRAECRPHTLEIVFDPSLIEVNAREGLLHEVLEAIDQEFDLDIPHHAIEALGVVLHQALVDNPALVEALTGRE